MIDHHVHLFDDLKTGFSLSPQLLSERLTKYNVEKAIVFSCVHPLLSQKNPYEGENVRILQAADQDHRFIPFMFVHPFMDDLDYVQKTDSNFCGFKIHQRGPAPYHYGDLRSSKVFRYLLETGKPIIFHTGYRDEARVKNLSWLTGVPSGPLVIAHSGDLIQGDLNTILSNGNFYIDVSPFETMIRRGFFVEEARRDSTLHDLRLKSFLSYMDKFFGKQRVVWGTDTPWCDNLIDDGYAKEVEIGRKMQDEGFLHTFLGDNNDT